QVQPGKGRRGSAMDTNSGLTRRDALKAAGAAGIAGRAAGADVRAADGPAEVSGLPHARPEDIGLDPRRLQVAYDLLERWTTGPDAPIPGGAILAGRSGKVVPPRFFGR